MAQVNPYDFYFLPYICEIYQHTQRTNATFFFCKNRSYKNRTENFSHSLNIMVIVLN